MLLSSARESVSAPGSEGRQVFGDVEVSFTGVGHFPGGPQRRRDDRDERSAKERVRQDLCLCLETVSSKQRPARVFPGPGLEGYKRSHDRVGLPTSGYSLIRKSAGYSSGSPAFLCSGW